MVKLQKQFDKTVNKKKYYRYMIRIPQEIIKVMNLKDGEEFEIDYYEEDKDIILTRLN